MTYSITHYNWSEHNEKILLTNDIGKYYFLTKSEFKDFINFKLEPDSEAFINLQARGFLYQDKYKYIADFEYDMAEMKRCLSIGTNLFILVLTDACNQNCIYCQAGGAHKSKMSIEICRKAIDIALQSPVSHMTIEFQGGEPTLNPEVLKFAVIYAKKIFAEKGKHVDFAIVSNLTSPEPEILRWLIKNDVNISTSLDGNRELHDYNRPLKFNNNSSYDAWREGVELYKSLCKECGKNFTLSAIQTTTRASLKFHREIIDEYLANGINNLYIRPLTPLGRARDNWDAIGYTPQEYLKFYFNLIDNMISRCKKGEYVTEVSAIIYLKRIFNGESVGHTEFRSPCGAASGQIAVNYNGSIYTCDEGRMLANMGDDIFKLGDINNNYKELLKSPAAHAVCTASCVEALPMCCSCVYSPYCSVCPVVNYQLEGDLFSRDENSYKCVISKGILNYIFNIIQRGDPEDIAVLRQWAENY